MFKRKRTQEEIFTDFGWWEKGCFLRQMTSDRCDYIESCVNRVYGKHALAQQEILEVGSGGGLICEDLARRGVVMTGIEPVEGALLAARLHAQRQGLAQNIHYLRGVGEALPFADGSFSVIVCLDVLEHVSDLKKTIEEVARVLAPGGTFVFDTINRTLLARAVLIWYGEHFPSGGLVPGIHHYHKFIKPGELTSLMVSNGLKVREVTGFMPRGFKQGRFSMGPGGPKGIAYVGYATKGR
jgi:2-polyprenyl-6-hydroxyphenyl methylase/3-demethylubiquinone-9 3-methyltransferase